jgi:hypothetical protein
MSLNGCCLFVTGPVEVARILYHDAGFKEILHEVCLGPNNVALIG